MAVMGIEGPLEPLADPPPSNGAALPQLGKFALAFVCLAALSGCASLGGTSRRVRWSKCGPIAAGIVAAAGATWALWHFYGRQLLTGKAPPPDGYEPGVGFDDPNWASWGNSQNEEGDDGSFVFDPDDPTLWPDPTLDPEGQSIP